MDGYGRLGPDARQPLHHGRRRRVEDVQDLLVVLALVVHAPQRPLVAEVGHARGGAGGDPNVDQKLIHGVIF